MSAAPSRLSLFAGTGVELEYMIVDAETLAVLPISDELIRTVTGAYQSDVERGRFCWSNELVLHVIELKTNGPAKTFRGLAGGFQKEVREINRRLAGLGARLMPTAMHPWMDPRRETRLWPHEFSPVYGAYNRIFGCEGHGWSNLQSLHLNLPFADDHEFAALHAAVRVLLPILPALAASSPIMDGRSTGWLDNRLAVYRTNSARIPSITGQVIPEAVFSESDYNREILHRMYRDIAPHDPEGVLQDEFLNARGAIARFSRGSIEIRVLDVQECPAADLAIAQLIVETLRALIRERWCRLEDQKAVGTDLLEEIFVATSRDAEAASVNHPAYLELFGLTPAGPCSAAQLWQHLAEQADAERKFDAEACRALKVILEQGTLARRILGATGSAASRGVLKRVYARLCHCLAVGEMFVE